MTNVVPFAWFHLSIQHGQVFIRRFHAHFRVISLSSRQTQKVFQNIWSVTSRRCLKFIIRDQSHLAAVLKQRQTWSGIPREGNMRPRVMFESEVSGPFPLTIIHSHNNRILRVFLGILIYGKAFWIGEMARSSNEVPFGRAFLILQPKEYSQGLVTSRRIRQTCAREVSKVYPGLTVHVKIAIAWSFEENIVDYAVFHSSGIGSAIHKPTVTI